MESYRYKYLQLKEKEEILSHERNYPSSTTINLYFTDNIQVKIR